MARLLMGAMCGMLLVTLAVYADERNEFKPLFNGKDLTGWVPNNGHADDWKVEDGVLKVTGRTDGGTGLLRTEKQYESFELHLEFKLFEGGNSGVFFRNPAGGHGLEIQLLDDFADKHRNLHNWQYNGSLYGMVGPSEQVSKQPGQWQTMTVKLNGQQLTVTLNGTVIVEADLDDMHRQHEGYRPRLSPQAGHLALQNYGDPIHFRNIRIRELK